MQLVLANAVFKEQSQHAELTGVMVCDNGVPRNRAVTRYVVRGQHHQP